MCGLIYLCLPAEDNSQANRLAILGDRDLMDINTYYLANKTVHIYVFELFAWSSALK